ncbi:imidazoleglycerol-phosphate dehydratase [Dethiosulfovibrio sp. F2B]|uniref:imidazoleglycerol-phosphate dehydratase n=1 Tax=Dethiosulfovibrio faecalis TaxID=2720018 RepID=UPI001F379B44|nr:imidazoleglycerol-phosphate dehydratase [Dethiosulfovibrio faecalis]MCF4152496.1 imidazoleglycerol-phosphate dehydratase [Dethiosulfovibrio faecalis]
MITLKRETKETSICLSLEISSEERSVDIDTGCGFMDHMLTLMAFHGGMSLKISARGDDVDDHHLTEDLAIVLGSALLKSLEGRKYERYGWCALPMDGSLALVAVDLSGRGSLTMEAPFPTEKCGTFDLELIQEFWRAFSREARATVHVKALAVDNSHHLAEAIFKGAGRALGQALAESGDLNSTKGMLL